jgi:periplasmic protein TonB
MTIQGDQAHAIASDAPSSDAPLYAPTSYAPTSYAASPDARRESLRFGACLAVVLAAHVAVALPLFLHPSQASDFDGGAPVVMLDLPEAPAVPATVQNDVTPGPPQDESEPTPRQEEAKPPEPESEIALPEPPKPEPPREERVATATPSVEVPPSLPAPPTAGAAVQPVPRTVIRWESALASHIERFKRYPAAARAHDEQGTVTIAFTLDRAGHVMSSHVLRSSGSQALDDETLAMLQRAQPLPPPPAEIPSKDLSFVVPVRFNIR